MTRRDPRTGQFVATKRSAKKRAPSRTKRPARRSRRPATCRCRRRR